MIELSLLVPVFNEEKIIEENLKIIIDFLKSQKYSWEIVLVDDGSRDKTVNIIKNFLDSKIRLVKLTKNSGKGAALRAGVMASNGKYIIFTDADLSVPITYTNEILDSLKSGNDVAIGSRRVKGASIEIHQPFFRELAGRFHTLLAQIFTGTRLSDYTCGFKGFETVSAKNIFARSQVDRWSYDDEILFLAHKFGLKISEVPVIWTNRFESRVSMGSAMITSFLDLFKIRLNDLKRKYD